MKLYNFEAAASMVGKELIRARQLRRVTRSALAMGAGISRVTLANLEAGRGSVASLIAVLAVLAHRFADQLPEVELGRWIARSRKRAGLSQERLCALAGVSKPALVRVERGEGNVATLLAAMHALGLSMSLIDVAIEAAPPPLPKPTARLVHGDCRESMRDFAQQGLLFDAIVTDPPYHLASISRRFGRTNAAQLLGGEHGTANPYRSIAAGFMGQAWDGGGVAFDAETWRAAFAAVKPGGYLVAFGGARTFHRLAVAIEDAGFEIRDTIMWVFGSGFPKSLTVQGPDGAKGTALKPAYEPIIVARRPIREATVAANVARFGTGALNIDLCRVGLDGERNPSSSLREAARRRRSGPGQPGVQGRTITSRISDARYMTAREGEALGRWPANLIHDGSPSVLSNFPTTGRSRGGGGKKVVGKTVYGRFNGTYYDGEVGYGDAGSTARFFYTAKASRADRGPNNNHPTVKPNDLMRYLVRLVTPQGGTVLDPFMGSGSTGLAAIQEDFSFVGCEQQTEYIEIARRRIAKAMPHREVLLSEPDGEPATRNAS